MPNWLRNALFGVGGLLVAVLLGMLLYRIGWYIAAWVLLVILGGTFVGLALLGRGITEVRWLTGLATAGLVIWIVAAWVWPVLYGAFDRSAPYTSRALGRRSVETDVRASEMTDPIALRGRISVVEYCREKEQVEEGRLQGELGELLTRRRAGTFTDADRTREAEALVRLRDIAKERRVCQQELEKLDKTTGLKAPEFGGIVNWLKGLPGGPYRIAFWGVVILLIAVGLLVTIGRVFRRRPAQGQAQGRSAASAVVGVAMLFLAALLADWLIWGSGWTKTREFASEAPVAAERFPRVVELTEPGVWTPIYGRLDTCESVKIEPTQLIEAELYRFGRLTGKDTVSPTDPEGASFSVRFDSFRLRLPEGAAGKVVVGLTVKLGGSCSS